MQQHREQTKEIVTFKNGASFTYCISEIYNIQLKNAKDLDVMMLMYVLVEYSDNYTKISVTFWQYYKATLNDNITYSESFQFEAKIKGRTPDAGNTKDVEIAVSLKYLSKFWRTFEISQINYKINLMLTQFKPIVLFLYLLKPLVYLYFQGA